jgi:hypothetical protein
MNKNKSWSFIGVPDRIREDRGGKLYTLLAASTCYGVELFMLLKGGVNAAIWCYFISEI